MPASEYTADLIAEAAAGGTAYQGPATIYLELVTTAPAPDTPGTPSGLGRIAVAQATFWSSDDAGKLTNAEIAAWEAATGDVGPVTHYERWDAASGGNMLGYDALSGDEASRTIVTGQIARFPVGALTLTVV